MFLCSGFETTLETNIQPDSIFILLDKIIDVKVYERARLSYQEGQRLTKPTHGHGVIEGGSHVT